MLLLRLFEVLHNNILQPLVLVCQGSCKQVKKYCNILFARTQCSTVNKEEKLFYFILWVFYSQIIKNAKNINKKQICEAAIQVFCKIIKRL